MKFNLDQEKINEEISKVKAYVEKWGSNGMDAVVRVHRVSPRKLHYGTHFENAGSKTVGDTVTLCGSTEQALVVAVVSFN